MAKNKKCRACASRTIGTGTGAGVDTGAAPEAEALELCNLCYVESNWENVHSDDGHGTEDEGSNSTDDCWVCHPELNLAQEDHTPRTGHTNTAPRSRHPHTACKHGSNPKERGACRKANRWDDKAQAWVPKA